MLQPGENMKPVLVLGLLGLASPLAMAEGTTALPNIVVFGENEALPNETELTPEEVPRIPAGGGDLLREALGVDSSRIGGHGFDPNIRGQMQTRLNVLLDNAYIHGGCPNRMDPPSSYAALDSYDRVTILKGVQSLLYGGGGSGGTVLFDRVTRAPEDGLDLSYGLAGTTNGIEYNAFGDATVGNEHGYMRAYGSTEKANDYTDGDGNEVRSSFNGDNGLVVLGLTPDKDKTLELSYEYNNVTDAVFAGRSMDAPDSTAKNTRFKYAQDSQIGFLTGLSFEAYNTRVSHLMDNYSLRELTAPMPLRVPSTSNTAGGRLLMDTVAGPWNLTFGIDMQNNSRNATRYTGPSTDNVNMTQSFLWPGAKINQTGLILEGEHPISGNRLVKAGIRYDYVTYDATNANAQPQAMAAMNPTPNELYATYYDGQTAQQGHENNFGFLLRYEQDLAANTRMFTGISRSMRTADATERYMASWMANPSMIWVGNPDIKPEAHHQADFGLNWEQGKYDANAVVYADFVNDYILRYRIPTQQSLYKNVTARIYGTELAGGYNITRFLRLSGEAAYVYGQDTTDDWALPQMPPLSGQVALDYRPGKWSLGTRVRAAARQDRIDENSGYDEETAGWSIVDVYGGYTLNRYIKIQAGVDNLFDKYYTNHLNAPDVTTGTAVQVPEPGVTGWLKLSGSF
jgi:iron complex outermembrane recepter protein